ncbi:MAG TPA: FtsX-like permease family protein, partial [Gemmatimonadaceae bacterium]
ADFGQPITLPVIGVVADVRDEGPRNSPIAEVYLPYTLEVWPWIGFDVRSSTPAQTLRAVKSAVRVVDPDVQFRGEPSIQATGIGTLDAQARFVAELLIGFSIGALLLASVGLYGMVAFAVSLRRREIGIRIALGATRQRILTLVIREGLAFVLVGAVIGLGGALATTRLLSGMLFDTKPTDMATLISVPLVLAVVAVVASWIPARRAARTDPTIAMRAE